MVRCSLKQCRNADRLAQVRCRMVRLTAGHACGAKLQVEQLQGNTRDKDSAVCGQMQGVRWLLSACHQMFAPRRLLACKLSLLSLLSLRSLLCVLTLLSLLSVLTAVSAVPVVTAA